MQCSARGLLAQTRVRQEIPQLGACATQVRWRQWLFPQATKGWRPERFGHEGQALQFARQSKRIPIWKLGWAVNISTKFLQMVERGEAGLLPDQRQELERVLGVPLKRRRRSLIERTP
eukprot:TRINITY_DN53919_c0_g1_i1.p2 TRINITY_DN53919_c0_g1~~TRINITY_DN53919_c0_g1_i1.p2  ORF type:complete len:136 (-),score=18.14 TRINITY_DN53919_c0_g1_i1:123-476(-)